MILRPTKKTPDIYLLSEDINMWLLRYLSKLQDKIGHLYYISSRNVSSLKDNSFEINHLYRKETKAALNIAVNSFYMDNELSFVGINNENKVITSLLIQKTSNVPIIIVDNHTNTRLISLIKNIKRELIIIEINKDTIYVFAKDENGNCVEGYNYLNTSASKENLSYPDKLMLSNVAFMIINKLIAQEALITNAYSVDTKEIKIIRK